MQAVGLARVGLAAACRRPASNAILASVSPPPRLRGLFFFLLWRYAMKERFVISARSSIGGTTAADAGPRQSGLNVPGGSGRGNG